MRSITLTAAAILLAGVAAGSASGDKPNLSGTWKLDEAHSESARNYSNLTLLIEQNDQSIHVKETRGGEVSDFTCGMMGKSCSMQDGHDKADVSVYFNGPVLVILKTNGRKGDSVTKWRLSRAQEGGSLSAEVVHIDPEEKTEKLVFSKVQ